MEVLSELENFSVTEWYWTIPTIAHLINNSPNVVTKLTPSYIMLGHSTADLLINNAVPELQEIWEKVRESDEAAKKKYLKGVQGPFSYTKLDKGALIFVYLNKQKIPASVVEDHGSTCLVQKEQYKNSRFRTVLVHKSMISLRFS